MIDSSRYKKMAPSTPYSVESYGFKVIMGDFKPARIGIAMLRAANTIRTYERLLTEAGIPLPKRTD